MWPWIKRWRDWTMRDLLNFTRSGVQLRSLHYSFEKAGLSFSDDQPIPWTADCVVVECVVWLAPNRKAQRSDFSLRIGDSARIAPEAIRLDQNDQHHLFFRFRCPAKSSVAEVRWHNRVIGQLRLSVLVEREFREQFSLEMPTLSVRMPERTIACETYVSTQCQGLVATAILASTTSLAPVADLGLRVEVQSETGTHLQTLPVELSSSQLRGTRAIVTAAPKKPRRSGNWDVSWFLGDSLLAKQRVKALSKKQFTKSLRISETRFILQLTTGEVEVARSLPSSLKGIVRVGPCFFLQSNERGMAGTCALAVRARINDAVTPPLLDEQDVLVTDGPTPFAPGTIDVKDLSGIQSFELSVDGKSLGILPLEPAPTANFSTEGGFKPAADFTWSTAAEDQLSERLERLLEN